MAASNARIVSRGRSSRGRVGLDRSGSTAFVLRFLELPWESMIQTYNVAVDIPMLDRPNGFHRGLFKSHGNCDRYCCFHNACPQQRLPGCTSFIALVGSAFEVVRFAAFSFDVSTRSALEKDPLRLCFFVLVKLNIDFVRGLRWSGPSAMASGFVYVVLYGKYERD